MSATWLNNAIFYEIYPQSFCDSNGDGIGDIPGIISKLDYVKSLGCNALWINPCFDSPFKDAGYDVRDYKKVAPRYGTNEDLQQLFQVAHEKGIHVLLDLVPGHTSEEHPWFLESAKAEKNEYSDRYIWTSNAFMPGDGMPFVGGEFPRNGTYILNFFKCQPALNYGYLKKNFNWQKSMDDPACQATLEAMLDVMRFWLGLGCDGYRVDMAASLVKNDDEAYSGTSKIWKKVREMLDAEYPEAALLAEWNMPQFSLKAGFDMDFYLDWYGNGYSSLMRDYEGNMDSEIRQPNNSYFKRDAKTDVSRFLADYLPKYEASKKDGLWCFITCNHDSLRPAPALDGEELKLAYAFLFTMPGAPFVYYGDEIGMRYRKLPTHEGGYHRTGSRTPMQWAPGKHLGFSTAAPEKLYLPVDPDLDAPTVAEQEEDPDSLLQFTRTLLHLRLDTPDLQAYSPFEVVSAKEGERLFAYRRGKLLCAVNPSEQWQSLALDGDYETLFFYGDCTIKDGALILDGPAFAVLKPAN